MAKYVVHCKRERYDVYIGRPSVWGNPYPLAPRVSRKLVIKRYIRYLLAHPELIECAREQLRGKVLGCWCAPRMCHGDVLVIVASAASYSDAIRALSRLLAR